MITDLAEVRRLGTAKTAENLEFRRYLTAHHQPVETFQILATEVQQHIDCKSCANCCKYSIVSVNAKEIERIAEFLELTPEEVTHRFTTHDDDSPKSRALQSNKTGCIFLKDNLCSIYEARPKACKDFPHVAAGAHSLGARIESHCRWVPLCPILYNALEGFKHLVGFHTGHGLPSLKAAFLARPQERRQHTRTH